MRAAAVTELVRSHRAEVLEEQVTHWELASRVRRYLVALEGQLRTLGDRRERAAAEAWMRWASDLAERIDPLNSTLAMPESPKVTTDALAPIMEGWNPYGRE